MEGRFARATASEADGDEEVSDAFDHEFRSYASLGAVNPALVDVCAECGDYHDERRQKLESLADRVSAKYLSGAALDASALGEGPVDPDAELKVALKAGAGVSLEAVRGVAEAARALKQAESAYRDAQQQYGEAVKRLSEEAVK